MSVEDNHHSVGVVLPRVVAAVLHHVPQAVSKTVFQEHFETISYENHVSWLIGYACHGYYEDNGYRYSIVTVVLPWVVAAVLHHALHR